MKLLTITVPCYNSQDYMQHCINSLLVGGEDVEILIVDDGSTDDTARIADEYEKNYPTIVRAIHKKNGGHGSGVNCGIKEAKGMYFKVVDSDDWVDAAAYLKILSVIRENVRMKKDAHIDMLISNFIYDKEGQTKKKVMNYRGIFPKNRIFTWKETGRMKKGHYILMHSVIYRTSLLRECGLSLPEHTFYVDNIFVYVPLPHVQNIMYLDEDFYHYYIGREDQSVHEDVMIKRIDQQLLVNRILIEAYDLLEINPLALRKYMFNYLEIITTVSTVLLLKSGTKENLRKKKELWRYMRKYNWHLFLRMRRGALGMATNLPGRWGRWMTVKGYKIAQKFIGFS